MPWCAYGALCSQPTHAPASTWTLLHVFRLHLDDVCCFSGICAQLSSWGTQCCGGHVAAAACSESGSAWTSVATPSMYLALQGSNEEPCASKKRMLQRSRYSLRKCAHIACYVHLPHPQNVEFMLPTLIDFFTLINVIFWTRWRLHSVCQNFRGKRYNHKAKLCWLLNMLLMGKSKWCNHVCWYSSNFNEIINQQTDMSRAWYQTPSINLGGWPRMCVHMGPINA